MIAQGAAPRATRLVLVRVGRLTCALSVAHVQEISRVRGLTRVPHAPDYVRGVLNLRGQLITVVDLGIRLGLDGEAATAPAGHVVVVRHLDAAVGLLVDRVLDSHEVTDDEWFPVPANAGPRSAFFSGVYRLQEGLAGELDLDAVLRP